MNADRAGPILVVDDDAKIVRLVRMYLERERYRVIEANDGASALEAFEANDPALVVLDLMLPEIDGLALVRAIRDRSDTPLIILSARGTTSDRIAGLGLGADDYLPKPFSPAELVLRIGRVLSRADGRRSSETTPILEHAGLAVDRDRHVVTVDGRAVEVTAVEFRLLVAMLESNGHVLTRDQLLDAVYGSNVGEILDRTIDVHVGRLRSKLGDPVKAPRFIATLRGAGYRLASLPAASTAASPPSGRSR